MILQQLTTNAVVVVCR